MALKFMLTFIVLFRHSFAPFSRGIVTTALIKATHIGLDTRTPPAYASTSQSVLLHHFKPDALCTLLLSAKGIVQNRLASLWVPRVWLRGDRARYYFGSLDAIKTPSGTTLTVRNNWDFNKLTKVRKKN